MKHNRMFTLFGLAMLAAVILSGCGALFGTATPASTTDQVGQVGGSNTEAATEAPALPDAVGAPPEAGGGAAGAYGGGGPAAMPTAMAAPAEAGKAGDAVALPGLAGGAGPAVGSGGPVIAPGGGPAIISPPDQQFQGMTAGEVDDNKDFSAYLQYRLDYHRFSGLNVHDLDISERHAIRVLTPGGQPVLGALVQVYDGQTLVTTLTTPATGIVYFFPLVYPQNAQSQGYTVVVQKDQASQSFNLTRANKDDVAKVTLNVEPTRPPIKLDVLFLLDSTGSMGDEIDQIKNNLLSISAQIAALPSRPDIRYGMVTYRDRGDQYVTRIADFTPSVQEFQAVLQGVQAAGGGDTPESLNEALHRAISDVHWRGGDTVQLIFLVSDAPPHLDYAQDYDYAQEIQNAAARGIKIEPIAASGLDDQGEYIFRQLAQVTGGHFIFLTYDTTPQTSGQPGTDKHVQEGSYTVKDLDQLVVKLVQDELAQLNGQQQ